MDSNISKEDLRKLVDFIRRSTYDAYSKYLRDLGMTADIRNVNEKSRIV